MKSLQKTESTYVLTYLPIRIKVNGGSVVKPRYKEPQYSEFRDLVNKTLLPLRIY